MKGGGTCGASKSVQALFRHFRDVVCRLLPDSHLYFTISGNISGFTGAGGPEKAGVAIPLGKAGWYLKL
jgi:hypothetical protein